MDLVGRLWSRKVGNWRNQVDGEVNTDRKDWTWGSFYGLCGNLVQGNSMESTRVILAKTHSHGDKESERVKFYNQARP